jgi:hypothetical protein
MDYDRIIIEMLSRIQVLEEKVTALEKDSKGGIVIESKEVADVVASSKKYRLLSDYLFNSKDDRVSLTLVDIEGILNFELPPSAYIHRPFWANTKTHSIALSWMSVGYKTVEVNIEERYVVFERERDYSKLLATGKKNADEVLSKFGNTKITELTSAEKKEGDI